jgi:hypothetical protein
VSTIGVGVEGVHRCSRSHQPASQASTCSMPDGDPRPPWTDSLAWAVPEPASGVLLGAPCAPLGAGFALPAAPAVACRGAAAAASGSAVTRGPSLFITGGLVVAKRD